MDLLIAFIDCYKTFPIYYKLLLPTTVSQNPTAGASIGEPRALAYTLRTAYVSYA